MTFWGFVPLKYEGCRKAPLGRNLPQARYIVKWNFSRRIYIFLVEH